MANWWDGVPDECYWMEITDRPDPGSDLNAPRLSEDGRPQWSYQLITEPAEGDVVFHFHKPSSGVVGYSFVDGDAWPEQVLWGAKGTSARERDIAPYVRPGLCRGLRGFTRVDVSLEAVRAVEEDVFAVRDRLADAHGERGLKFPFTPYRGQSLRTFQGYFVKMPRDLIPVIGLPMVEPSRAAQVGRQRRPSAELSPDRDALDLGAPYRRADEQAAVAQSDPVARDPSVMERALRSHRVTQNALADLVAAASLTPLRPEQDDPDWDLAWRADGRFYVAEVKSITDSNEEKQLRIGLGQVLRYADRIESEHRIQVVPVLVASQKPADRSWVTSCSKYGVRLVWSGHWDVLELNIS